MCTFCLSLKPVITSIPFAIILLSLKKRSRDPQNWTKFVSKWCPNKILSTIWYCIESLIAKIWQSIRDWHYKSHQTSYIVEEFLVTGKKQSENTLILYRKNYLVYLFRKYHSTVWYNMSFISNFILIQM